MKANRHEAHQTRCNVSLVSFYPEISVHHSRLCAVLIDFKTSNVDEAADFWAGALGRGLDAGHPGSRGNYRMLESQPDEPIVQMNAGSSCRRPILRRQSAASRFSEERQPVGVIGI